MAYGKCYLRFIVDEIFLSGDGNPCLQIWNTHTRMFSAGTISCKIYGQGGLVSSLYYRADIPVNECDCFICHESFSKKLL